VLSDPAHHPGGHGVRTIATTLGMSASTTFRLLDALVVAGLARHDEQSGKYTVGIQTVQVGSAAMAGFDLTAVGRRSLRATTKGLPADTANTNTDPAAFSEEEAAIRFRGYAVDREEIEEGLVCMVAPIFDYSGRAVGAMSLAGPTTRVLPTKCATVRT
jgi:DNA-binding IclR family transcriptional regulator